MNGPLSLQFRLALVSLCLFLFCFSTTSVLSIKINEIQGTRFISPYNGQTVKEIHGIVTGIDIKYGFYLQDPNPDSNPVTSEGIFVYHPTVTTDPLKLVPGDEIIISEAVVAEFKPKAVSMWMDGTYYNSVTQLTRIQKVRKLSSGKLGSITPSILGGPNMPTEIIFAKDPFEVAASQVHVEALNLPLNLSRGLDYFESMEGMMVIIPSPVAVSVEVPRGDAFWAVSDNGDYATGMNSHGGITITQSPTSAGVIDANPERIQVGRMLDKSKSTVKPLTVGSKLRDIIGLVNFSFGNWKVYPIEPVSIISVNQANNVTTRYPQSVRVTACDLVIANYNVENLHVSNPEKKFLRLADQFVKNLKSPDIVGLQEIQGDKVDSADGLLVSSSDTMKKLIRYIKSAGGPAYEYVEVASINNMDGGKPGGNIRPVFMYRPDRVTLLKTSGGRGGPSDAQKLETLKDESLSLKYNPGRVDPENAAWARSRKAISAVFDFNGERVFVINNHWKSKLGSGPLFGSLQPSSNGGVASRMAQSQVVVDFVKEIMTLDPTANVVVQGDFNEFQMVQPLLMLAAAGVTDLMEHHMAPSERYSYVYDGNSQALDHILVSGNLLGKSRVEVLHLNTLNPKNEGASDHDPVLSSINLCKKKRKFSSI